MKYRSLTHREEEQALIQIMDVLLDNQIPFSGKHRKAQWEKGWGENVKNGTTTPKYFGKYEVNRLDGRLVIGQSKNYEQAMLYTIVDKLIKKYLATSPVVFEFGCGTGHNLLRVRKVNKKAFLVGCDWTKSSQKLVNKLGKGFSGVNFDFFHPPKWTVREDSAVYTVAALEQTGTNYTKFVSWLLKGKPSVVVHIEPIPELLDSSKLLDYLSIKYMEKRRYLSGYLDYLRLLEKKGKVKVLEACRSGIGSMFIDGYSIVVWKPL